MSQNPHRQIKVNYLGLRTDPVGYSTKKCWYEQQIAVFEETGSVESITAHLVVVERTAYDEKLDFEIPTRLPSTDKTLMFDEFIKPRPVIRFS